MVPVVNSMNNTAFKVRALGSLVTSTIPPLAGAAKLPVASPTINTGESGVNLLKAVGLLAVLTILPAGAAGVTTPPVSRMTTNAVRPGVLH